ncbi:hypothetical protein H0H93_008601 [Arthromyces matolae]|nr:hypothetical protein H0H93_008601 [Arthromyces matolae]
MLKFAPTAQVNLARRLALKGGVAIVRDLLAKHEPLKRDGLTTDELYNLALTCPPPAAFYNPLTLQNKKGLELRTPFTNPEHPKEVLPFLEATREIEKKSAHRLVKRNTLYNRIKNGKKVLLYPNDENLQMEPVWVWKPVDPENPPRKPTKLKLNPDLVAFVNSLSESRPSEPPGKHRA